MSLLICLNGPQSTSEPPKRMDETGVFWLSTISVCPAATEVKVSHHYIVVDKNSLPSLQSLIIMITPVPLQLDLHLESESM